VSPLHHNYYVVMVTQFTTTVFVYKEHRPEEGLEYRPNMLVRIWWRKHVINVEVYFVCLYIYIYDRIDARKLKRIEKRLILFVLM
jgi:hypothetical protein